MEQQKYEWKAMSVWLMENMDTGRVPEDDGWELVGGALRRAIPQLLTE